MNNFNENMILNKFNEFVNNRKVLIISFAATAIFTLIFNRIEYMIAGDKGAGYFLIQLAFSKQNFELIVASWGKAGVDLFLKSMTIDFLYIISYTTLFASAPVYFNELKNKKLSSDKKYNNKLLLIPLLAGSFDIIENIFHIIILSQRIFTNELVLIASIAATMKWILILCSLVILLKKYFEMRKS